MKPMIYISLFLIIGITSCQNVTTLVNSIADENRVECKRVGLAGSASGLYKKFEQLKRSASKKELIQLMDHDSLSVVGYSLYALIDRELIAPNRLLERFINQDEKVSTFCGCIMDEESLASLIYHRYWNTRIEYSDEVDYENFKINDSEELQKMDSIILFSNSPDWILLSRAFENRVYPEDYKSKIEDWAFNKGDFYALKYVFKNLSSGNKEKLEFSLNEYLKNDAIYKVRKEDIKQMLKNLKETEPNKE